MIRCDSCANSKHCDKITSSNMECSQYVCNLNFSVGQTISFVNREQGYLVSVVNVFQAKSLMSEQNAV